MKYRFKTYYPFVLIVISALLLILSFCPPSQPKKLKHEASRVEKALHKRQNEIDKYAMALLNSEDGWSGLEDIPDDMVIYRFSADTLLSWANQFPIINDNIDAYKYPYRLQYSGSRNLHSSPLAYIGLKEQYVNLGSGWYVVNSMISKDHRFRIVTGIRVRTDYDNPNVKNEVNENLGLRKGYTAESINVDASAVVYGVEGEPLFSIVTDEAVTYDRIAAMLRWVSLLAALVAVFTLHYRKHSKYSFLAALSVLVFARGLAAVMARSAVNDLEIFSPILYADNALNNSLGSLLLNNTFIAMFVYALYVMRLTIYRKIVEKGKGAGTRAIIFFSVAALILIWYTHIAFHSLIINSNIEFEVTRLDSVSVYSILCYTSLAMLFLALIYILQMTVMFVERWGRINLFSWKSILAYIGIVSLWSVSMVGIHGLEKEYEVNRVRTGKLAVERDLSLELSLRNIEQSIANDPFIAILSTVNGVELIRNRLLERYLTNDIISNYDVNLTVCSPDNLLDIGAGAEPVACFSFYDDMVRTHGTELAGDSNFYFLNNYDGQISYVGVFPYFNQDSYAVSRLFIEISSRFQNSASTNPFDAISAGNSGANNLPSQYSYAKYAEGRLVSYGGSYPYPVNIELKDISGYQVTSRNGYVHFVNSVTKDSTTVLTRRRTPFLPYLVLFSYLALFFGLFLLLFTRWGRETRLFNLPRHTFKRRITFLTTISMSAALVCMGLGSVIFVIRLNKANNERQIADKIETVQNTLSPYCRYARLYNDLMTDGFAHEMDNLSKSSQTDINIYDTDGTLIRSTRPELFDRYLKGTRMDHDAYKAIRIDNSLRFSTVETLAGIKYDSAYAPLFNSSGEMVGIVNIPYLNRNRDVASATLSTVSAVINIYMLLLIAAIALGAILSNSISRPLAEIKENLNRLASSRSKKGHIKYSNKDELGLLVESYNKMVDDLEESTRLLAQNERELAWKEMARQIAHEIKNPLTPMRLSIEHLMRLKQNNVPGWEDKMDRISASLLTQIDTLANTASQFSSFSKGFSEAVTEINLDELIKEQAVIHDNRDDIHIKYVQKVDSPIIEARKDQIERVFMNLITNAVQAIDSSSDKGGNVAITIDSFKIDGKLFYRTEIEDNGPGVSEENLSKLFTPDFTTKSSGTGLGLAISKSIIEESRGTISYRKSDMGGACFSIVLPAKES